MSENVCPQCGAPIDPGASECKFCGEKLAVQQAGQQMQQQSVNGMQQGQPTIIIQNGAPAQQPQQFYTAINPSWPIKSKVAAGILAIFLGGLGVHKFYLGQVGKGILYLLFCWTFIPAIVAFVEGIIYLTQNDENFQLKNHVRVG